VAWRITSPVVQWTTLPASFAAANAAESGRAAKSSRSAPGATGPELWEAALRKEGRGYGHVIFVGGRDRDLGVECPEAPAGPGR
jgi:hypothetical protein